MTEKMFYLRGKKRQEVKDALIYAETKMTGNIPIISNEVMKFIPKWSDEEIRKSIKVILSIQAYRRYIFHKGRAIGFYNKETRLVKKQCMRNHKLKKYVLSDNDKENINLAYKCSKHHISCLYDGYDIILSSYERKLLNNVIY